MEKSLITNDRNKRIQVLDQLRGFALLLIFLVNLPELSRIYLGSDNSLQNNTFSSNYLHNIIQLLFGDSARPLFAFMFGISMILIYDRIKKRGKNPFFVLFRRMITLLLIGGIHFFYIWHGDILLMYGLDGLILLFFVSLSAWPLLLFSLLSIFLFNEVNTLSININNNIAHLGSGLVILITHTFGQFFWFGSMQSYDSNTIIAGISYQLYFAIPHLFFFLTGMLAYRLDIFTKIPKHKILGWFTAILLLSVGLYSKHMLLEPEVFSWMLIWKNIINFSVAIGMAFAIILIGSSKKLSILIRPFTAVGRMAFTNYLLQSLVFVSVFIESGEGIFKGHGLINSIQFSILLPFALLFFGLQMWGSTIWLRHFYYGPFEWLWRWGTNLQLPPMRRKKSMCIEDK